MFLPAATARWSINAVSPPSSPSPTSPHKTIEQGSIETNELNMTLMRHMTRHDSVRLIMTHMTKYDSYDSDVTKISKYPTFFE